MGTLINIIGHPERVYSDEGYYTSLDALDKMLHKKEGPILLSEKERCPIILMPKKVGFEINDKNGNDNLILEVEYLAYLEFRNKDPRTDRFNPQIQVGFDSHRHTIKRILLNADIPRSKIIMNSISNGQLSYTPDTAYFGKVQISSIIRTLYHQTAFKYNSEINHNNHVPIGAAALITK